MGPYHSVPLPPTPTTPARKTKLPDGPPDPILPKALQPKKSTPHPPTPPNVWKTIPLKKVGNGVNPHAAFIPAYNPANAMRKETKPMSPASSHFPSVSIKATPPHKEAQKQRRRLQELQTKRAEAVMTAGRAWQKGNSKNHGGEIALYYAEQARALQEEARKIALDDARTRVEAKRCVV